MVGSNIRRVATTTTHLTFIALGVSRAHVESGEGGSSVATVEYAALPTGKGGHTNPCILT